jgi:poly(hydroxyalkanoate) granule-associated protein
MVKKMNTTDSSTSSDTASGTGEGRYSSLLESQLANSVKESAHQIWLAGMGAFAKAQEEGGKVFEALVKEGSKLQKKTQGLAEDKIGEVTEKMSAMADTVTSRAGQNWDKLEAIFEQRTAKALTKLGVPTAKDVEALMKRVDDLSATVGKMGAGVGSTSAAGPRRTASAGGSRARPAAKSAATSVGKATAKTGGKAAVKTAAKTAARTAATNKRAGKSSAS